MTNRTVVLPDSWISKINAAGRASGRNFNQTVLDAIAKQLGINTEDGVILDTCMGRIRGHVLQNYSQDSFPPNVTAEVFKVIETDKPMRETYEAALKIVGARKLHQSVGRMIRFVLNAETIGRATVKDSLIDSYTLLRPYGKMVTL